MIPVADCSLAQAGQGRGKEGNDKSSKADCTSAANGEQDEDEVTSGGASGKVDAAFHSLRSGAADPAAVPGPGRRLPVSEAPESNPRRTRAGAKRANEPDNEQKSKKQKKRGG